MKTTSVRWALVACVMTVAATGGALAISKAPGSESEAGDRSAC
jgi:hypothetical protein